MDRILQIISEFLGISEESSIKLLLSIATAIILGIVQFAVLKVALRNVIDTGARYKWGKTTRFVITIIGILLIGRIWFEGVGAIGTYMALVAAGLVIVLREPVQDIAAFLFIMWRHPFRLGDRIAIKDATGIVKGDVIDQGLFKFTLMEIGEWVDADQSTGRVVHVSNHRVFIGHVYNYTGGFKYIWNEVTVRLAFESNWRKARELLLEIANRYSVEVTKSAEQEMIEAASTYYLNYNILTPTVYVDIKDYGISLTIRYLTEPRRRRGTQQQISEAVLDMVLANDDIMWAYPTSRVYRAEIDGKDENWLGFQNFTMAKPAD
jgi:small-conductance mechanosensitive channel